MQWQESSGWPGAAVSVLRRSQLTGLRLRLDDSNTKRLPNTSIYN